MKLSLSVRIAEGFLSKEEAIMPLEEVASLAVSSGYQAICMRASQVGVHSSADEVAKARKQLDDAGLQVSMVTGDFDTVYNNENGPAALRKIQPYLDLAQQLGADMIRVALKTEEDIQAAQVASDLAEKAGGIRLVHQCHTRSLFETVGGIVETMKRIDRPNFGIIYEPANLELCGEDYVAAIKTLRPYMMNVYLQNQNIHDGGAVELDTWCRGPSKFDIIPIHALGGIDFAAIMQELKACGYNDTVTVHQSASEGEEPLDSVSQTADFLRALCT